MTKKFLTLMVIPHHESHVREFHLSRPFLWGLYLILGGSIFLLFYYAIGYYSHIGLENRYTALQAENKELDKQLNRVQESLDNLRLQITDLTDKDRMMRAWVNLEEPGDEIRQMGVGGGLEAEASWEELLSSQTSEHLTETFTSMDQLLREAQFLQTSFDSILAVLSRNDEARRSTPSIWPVGGVRDKDNWKSSGFGIRTDPFTGKKQRHYAVDIAGRRGTAILATADGVVEKINFHKRLGNYITLKHGVYRTLYGHLNKKPTLKVGTLVKRGQRIGEMGKTGRTTATHLHYSVIQNNRAMDPMRFVWDDAKRRSIY